MKDIAKIKTVYTHGSVFHADDVFSTALILLLKPNVDVVRIVSMDVAQKMDEKEDCLVYDIGEGEYDHHQKNKARRPMEDGWYTEKDGTVMAIPYCSFGLLWKDYGHLLCSVLYRRR